MDFDMYNAVEKNEPETLRRLLREGGNVNAFFQDMTLISAKSILHMCCEKGRIDCVKVLLDMGADPFIRDTWYQTPLMYCMLTQWYEIGDLLLEYSPDMVDIGDKYGKSALHIAVEVGSIECVQVLLRHGADVNTFNDKGVTPLNAVCGDKTIEPDTVLEIVRLLLEAGANPGHKDFHEQRTALQRAMITANISIVEMLLGVGSDPNTIDSAGRCPITNLLWYHRHPGDSSELDDNLMMIVVMLIQAGANLNLCRYEFSNALCMATLYGIPSLVQYFLYNGADQNVDFYCGVTPLQIATRKKDVRSMKILLQWKSDLYREGRVKRGQLDYRADVFHLAIDIGAFEIATLLVEVGYDLSRVEYLRDWSTTPPDTLIENQYMLEYFRQGAMLVQSLFRLALLKIRECLDRNIPENAQLLPLPKTMIKAVLLEDELT